MVDIRRAIRILYIDGDYKGVIYHDACYQVADEVSVRAALEFFRSRHEDAVITDMGVVTIGVTPAFTAADTMIQELPIPK